MSQPKVSKIEKAFYKKSNFQLLKDVITDSFPVKTLPKNIEDQIIKTMDHVFQNTKLPRITSKTQRPDLIQNLNKNVLSQFMGSVSKLQKTPQTQGKPVQRPQSLVSQDPRKATEQLAGLQPGIPIHSLQPSGEYSTFPPNSDASFYLNQNHNAPPVPDRHMPNILPELHPKVDINEFPRPQGTFHGIASQETDVALSHMKDQRNALFQKNKVEEPDFSLPKMKEENMPDPKQKFEEMLKIREAEEKALKEKKKPDEIHFESQKVYKPKEALINAPEYHKAFQSESFLEGIDIPEDQLNNIQPIEKSDPPVSTFYQVKLPIEQSISEKTRYVPGQNGTYRIAPPTPSSSSEELSYRPTREKQTRYLTISSLSRDIHLPFSVDSFSLPIYHEPEPPEEYVTEQGITLFTKSAYKQTGMLPGTELDNVEGVECSDISVPKTLRDALEEPYLWLRVAEWGSIARVRPVQGHPDSSFITLKPIESKIIPVIYRSLPENLTVSLVRPTGQPCPVSAPQLWIELIEESEGDTVVTIKNHNIQVNDALYFYSMFPDTEYMVDGNASFRMSAPKLSKKVTKGGCYMKFDLFAVHPEHKDYESSNKICSFMKKTPQKFEIPLSDFLSEGDLFFYRGSSTNKETSYWCSMDTMNSTSVTVFCPSNTSHEIPKKVSRFGFLNRLSSGTQSDHAECIHYRGGFRVSKINGDKITIRFPYEQLSDTIKYFPKHLYCIPRKSQSTFTFRLH